MSQGTNLLSALLGVLFQTPCEDRDSTSALFTGMPGVGKTSRIRGLAQAAGYHVETIIPAIREPGDFLGIPVRTETGLEYLAPSWAKRAAQHSRSLVVFDEISRAIPAVQNALMRVLLEGVVGDLVLPTSVRFVGIMNPPETSIGAYDLDPALANRFVHIDWSHCQTDLDEWVLYMNGLRNNTEHLDTRKPTEEHFSKANAIISGYLCRKKDNFRKQPKLDDPGASKGWGSDRTWMMASRLLATCFAHGVADEVQDILVEGAVGRANAIEVRAWSKSADLPNAKAVLDGTEQFKHNPARIDRTYALIQAIWPFIAKLYSKTERKLDKDRAQRVWALLDDVSETAPDMCFKMASELNEMGGGMYTIGAAPKVTQKITRVLTEAQTPAIPQISPKTGAKA